MATGVFGVNVSAGRTVENFLDMGHFPYVHSGILGEEPHTEVKEYEVEISDARDEVLATSCKFYQPQAAVSSNEGMDVDYIYRVPHINCALLYKSSPVDDARLDVIIIFVQPMGEEWVGRIQECALLMMTVQQKKFDSFNRRYLGKINQF